MPCGNHDLKKTCSVEGCEKLGRMRGICNLCGMPRRRSKCNAHGTRTSSIRVKYRRYKKDQCELCNTGENLTVHHVDGNHLNNSPSNLQTLCRKCHDKVEGITPHSSKPKKKERHIRRLLLHQQISATRQRRPDPFAKDIINSIRPVK